MRNPKRKWSMWWIQTQSCAPHSPSLKTGAGSVRGLFEGRCAIGGMTVEGALGSAVLVP